MQTYREDKKVHRQNMKHEALQFSRTKEHSTCSSSSRLLQRSEVAITSRALLPAENVQDMF